jgi:hypothetical protein
MPDAEGVPHFSPPLREVGILDRVGRTLLSAAFDLGLEVDRVERALRPLAFDFALDLDREGHSRKVYFFCCAYSFARMKCSDT